ncbi:TetR/AcrR family transcriptional regulator [Sphingomonas sp. MMS24-JH45]
MASGAGVAGGRGRQRGVGRAIHGSPLSRAPAFPRPASASRRGDLRGGARGEIESGEAQGDGGRGTDGHSAKPLLSRHPSRHDAADGRHRCRCPDLPAGVDQGLLRRTVGGYPGRLSCLSNHALPILPQRRLTEKGLATRNRILDATVACIVRSGFAATTIETVMAEAGLSRGSAPHQFPTRLDLAVATAERSMRRVMEAARERAEAIPDRFERLAGYAQIGWEMHSLPDGLALTDILQAGALGCGAAARHPAGRGRGRAGGWNAS